MLLNLVYIEIINRKKYLYKILIFKIYVFKKYLYIKLYIYLNYKCLYL